MKTDSRARLRQLENTLPALLQDKRFHEARTLAKEIVELNERLAGEKNIDVAASLNNLAYICKQLGDLDRAAEYYRLAVDIWESKALADEALYSDPDYASVLNNLAMLHQSRGEQSEAEPIFRKSVRMLRASCGADVPEFHDILNTLGHFLKSPSDEETLHRAEEMSRRVILLGQCSKNLAATLESLNKYLEAEPLYHFALEIFTSLCGPTHLYTLETAGAIAQFHERSGHADQSEQFMSGLATSLARVLDDRPYKLSPLPGIRPVFEAMAEGLKAEAQSPETDERIGEEAIQRTIRALVDEFIQQNYSMCFRHAIRLNAVSPSLEVLQLFFLSLQWLDGPYRGVESDTLHRLVEPVLRLTTEHDWANTLLRLGLGQIDVDSTLAKANSLAQRCQAHFYAGWRFLIEGRTIEAHSQLGRCLEVEVDILERRIAERTAAQKPPGENRRVAQEISQVNTRVANLVQSGHVDEALPLAQHALEVAEANLPKGDLERRRSMYNAAALHYKQGDYAGAEKPFFSLVSEGGTGNPKERSATLNGLGLVYTELGRYSDAEKCLLEAVSVAVQAGLEHDVQTAQAIGNLAELKREQSDFAAATPLYERVIGIYRREAQKTAEFARWLNNFGILQLSLGDHQSAFPLLQEALQLRRELLPKDHPDVGSSLSSMGMLEIMRRHYGDAEPYLVEASEINRCRFGDNHPRYAASLNNIANLRATAGNLTDAEELLKSSVSISATHLGAHHPSLLTLLINLALVQAANGKLVEAYQTIEEAQESEDFLLAQVYGAGSERQRIGFVQKVHQRLHVAVSICASLGNPARLIGSLYDLVLRRKGIAAEAQAVQREQVFGGRHPALKPQLEALANLRTKLAALTLAGPGIEGHQFNLQFRDDLNRQREELEASIARQIPELSLRESGRTVDHHIVAHLLPFDSALVEFLRFEKINFSDCFSAEGCRVASPHYVAFVLKAGESDMVQMVEMGPADPINELIAQFRGAVTGELELRQALVGTAGGAERGLDDSDANPRADMRHLSPAPTGEGEASLMQVGRMLRAAVFDPVLPHLGSHERLFLAPDGDLSRLPFEALPMNNDHHVLDDFCVSYLGVGRDILHFQASGVRHPGAALVVADPDFNLGSAGPRSQFADRIHERQSRDVNRQGLQFAPLSGTRREGQEIAKILNVSPLLGNEALERHVKRCRSPRILHIATHGFFLPNQKGSTSADAVVFGMLGTAERLQDLENPLLRSGLVLAGANTWLKGGTVPDDAEDGLLTAEDVTGLDLVDTEMAVLSACETGLGQIHLGEGVFGLQRAFVLAGAKTLVISLWKVPDAQTQELMTNFYKHLRAGVSRAEALRKAQIALKRDYPEPAYWAAFICHGQPGPLQIDQELFETAPE
jgi:CHAT domain-containing protein/tetratricopeptide (TPR) repeat protein